MESFFSFLEKRGDDCSSLLCIGLDPHIPDLKQASADAARDFCLNLVKQTSRYAAAFKPNAAFFEVFSTAEAYAKSAFENLGVDCITLSPYLGKDSIEPFLQDSERGVFLLCKTSNPGSGDLQDLMVDGPQPMPLYEHVAHLAQTWNTKNNIGLVVGATHIEAMERVRAAAPDLWFLAPGVGAQGGELEAALKAGLRKDGKGLLLPVSRGVARAEKPGLAAAELRDEILSVKRSLMKM
jgi:uridine monophosphate synthetase